MRLLPIVIWPEDALSHHLRLECPCAHVYPASAACAGNETSSLKCLPFAFGHLTALGVVGNMDVGAYEATRSKTNTTPILQNKSAPLTVKRGAF